MSDVQPLSFVETLPPEEVARANFYALLARLFGRRGAIAHGMYSVGRAAAHIERQTGRLMHAREKLRHTLKLKEIENE